jgi:hypothetical protein
MRAYNGARRLVWNFYALICTCVRSRSGKSRFTLGATMKTRFQAGSAARAIDSAQRNNLVRKPRNNPAGRSRDDRGQSPFSPLLCILLLVAAGMLAKFGPALQSFHLAH